MKRLLLLLLLPSLMVIGCGESEDPMTHRAKATSSAIEPAGSPSVRGTLGNVPNSARGISRSKSPTASLAGVNLPAGPTGPPTPEKGWHVALADGFRAPIGTGSGEDNLWFASLSKGHNSNELETFDPSQVAVTPEGLELRLTYCAACSESYGTKKNWLGGQIETIFSGSTEPTSHPNLFEWTPKQGDEWAFQTVMKIPPNNEAMDSAFWSTDAPWTEELDFVEWWGWNHPEYYAGIPVFVKSNPGTHKEIYKAKSEIPNPESFHTYTWVVRSNSSVDVYIDGNYRWSTGPTSPNTPKMGLILQAAMRTKEPASHAQIATYIKSVEVWNNTGQHYVGGGTAPGTCVEGTSCSPTPAPEPPPTTTTSTTPTPPPPSEKPAAPTNVKVSSISTSTSPGLSIKWSGVSGATSYKLFRSGNENIEGRKPGEQWGPSTTATELSNHQLVTSGGWYCYRVAAVSAAGQSPYSEKECATA
jgi:hypothetical protein